jgi:hypothetical protein
VIYRGTIPEQPHRFDLDAHHAIEAGKVFPVCGNTFRMLQQSRFAPHFSFLGDFERHFGLFAGCGSEIPFASRAESGVGGCC